MSEYRKPELAYLGEAAVLIQGVKQGVTDMIPTLFQRPDCELDD